MKKGARLGTIILLVVTLALAAAGTTGLVFSKQLDAAQQTPYEKYIANVRKYEAESNSYKTAAEQALSNMDGYIARMEVDVAAFTAAGGDEAKLKGFLDAAKQQRADAAKNMETIVKKCEDIAKYEGYSAEDSEAVEKANSDLFKVNNQVKAALKKICKITDTESKDSSETAVRKQYEKAAAALAAECEASGISLGLEPFTIAQSALEVMTKELEKVSTLEREMEQDSGNAALSEELTRGWKSYLRENWDYCYWLAGLALIICVLCLLGWINPALLKAVGKVANKNMMLIALVLITLFFFVTTGYSNLKPANIYNVINQYSYIIILATGMLLCIVSSANIDLSVGRVMGFIGACCAKFVIDGSMPVWLAMIVCLLIGICIGAWQGFWIAYMKIPAFVVTLAGQLTFYGLTMVLLNGETKAPFPDAFNKVFGASLPDFLGKTFGFDSSFNFTTFVIGALVIAVFMGLQLRKRLKRVSNGQKVEALGLMIVKMAIISAVLLWLFYSLAQNKGMPTVLITVAIVLMVYTFFTGRTVAGRHLYAMGGNVNAARLSGVKTQRMLFLVYVNMGFLAALAGLAFTVRANSAFPSAGQGEELNAIAACYIGGASAYGGIGTVGGALVGALTMGIIKNGMSIMGMQQSMQQVVLGLVLLVAVVVDIVSKSSGVNLPFLSRFGSRKNKKL